MFDRIGSLVEWILQFFPHLIIVKSTHRAVKFVKGKTLVLVEPGLCWYWPLVTELYLLAVARRTANLPVQRLATHDGRRVIASAYIVYRVIDPVKAVGQTWDFDDTIVDVATGAIASIVTQQDYAATLETLSTDTADTLRKACRSGLLKYGVMVSQCRFTDFCEAEVVAMSHSGDLTGLLAGDEE